MPSARTTLLTPSDVDRKWFVVDAARYPLGRLASRVAEVLMGKHQPTYTPHIDTGDFVVVVNAEKAVYTGSKPDKKTYQTYSLYPGGQRTLPLARLLESTPERVVRLAVKRMLPKSKLGKHMLKKLKVHRGAEHPHGAQKPAELTV